MIHIDQHRQIPNEVTTLKFLDDQQYLKAYEQAFSSEHANALSRYLPSYMHRGMVLYILTGVFPGSFLSALLDGDLFTTLTYADTTNIKILHQYGNFLFNYAPRSCFGDPDSVLKWGERGGQLGPPIIEEQNIA